MGSLLDDESNPQDGEFDHFLDEDAYEDISKNESDEDAEETLAQMEKKINRAVAVPQPDALPPMNTDGQFLNGDEDAEEETSAQIGEKIKKRRADSADTTVMTKISQLSRYANYFSPLQAMIRKYNNTEEKREARNMATNQDVFFDWKNSVKVALQRLHDNYLKTNIPALVHKEGKGGKELKLAYSVSILQNIISYNEIPKFKHQIRESKLKHRFRIPVKQRGHTHEVKFYTVAGMGTPIIPLTPVEPVDRVTFKDGVTIDFDQFTFMTVTHDMLVIEKKDVNGEMMDVVTGIKLVPMLPTVVQDAALLAMLNEAKIKKEYWRRVPMTQIPSIVIDIDELDKHSYMKEEKLGEWTDLEPGDMPISKVSHYNEEFYAKDFIDIEKKYLETLNHQEEKVQVARNYQDEIQKIMKAKGSNEEEIEKALNSVRGFGEARAAIESAATKVSKMSSREKEEMGNKIQVTFHMSDLAALQRTIKKLTDLAKKNNQ